MARVLAKKSKLTKKAAEALKDFKPRFGVTEDIAIVELMNRLAGLVDEYSSYSSRLKEMRKMTKGIKERIEQIRMVENKLLSMITERNDVLAQGREQETVISK